MTLAVPTPNTIVSDRRLTTAEILYRMPDHPAILQTYVWQAMDQAPSYPALRKFLDFWRSTLDGELHSVRVATAAPPARGRWRHPAAIMRLH